MTLGLKLKSIQLAEYTVNPWGETLAKPVHTVCLLVHVYRKNKQKTKKKPHSKAKVLSV